jgi:hypothetical protein
MAAYQTFSHQPSFPGFSNLAEAVEELASAGAETRGAIFTRPEVVDFILDLVGYTADQPLHRRRILEPSFGGGDFLFAIARRLLSAYRSSGGKDVVADLSRAICAVELHRATFQNTCGQLENLLLAEGIERADARALRDAWLVRDDFLLTAIEGKFTHVVGNPPYVRQELIPQVLIDEYRSRYSTIYDRADMYEEPIRRSPPPAHRPPLSLARAYRHGRYARLLVGRDRLPGYLRHRQ